MSAMSLSLASAWDVATFSAIWLWNGSSVAGSRPVSSSSARPALISSMIASNWKAIWSHRSSSRSRISSTRLRELPVVDRVFFVVGPGVVTDGVFHLRSLGPDSSPSP